VEFAQYAQILQCMKSSLDLTESITIVISLKIMHSSKILDYNFNNLIVFDGELSVGMTAPEKCDWSCCHLRFDLLTPKCNWFIFVSNWEYGAIASKNVEI